MHNSPTVLALHALHSPSFLFFFPEKREGKKEYWSRKSTRNAKQRSIERDSTKILGRTVVSGRKIAKSSKFLGRKEDGEVRSGDEF